MKKQLHYDVTHWYEALKDPFIIKNGENAVN